jgi:hypothetical protein
MSGAERMHGEEVAPMPDVNAERWIRRREHGNRAGDGPTRPRRTRQRSAYGTVTPAIKRLAGREIRRSHSGQRSMPVGASCITGWVMQDAVVFDSAHEPDVLTRDWVFNIVTGISANRHL